MRAEFDLHIIVSVGKAWKLGQKLTELRVNSSQVGEAHESDDKQSFGYRRKVILNP